MKKVFKKEAVIGFVIGVIITSGVAVYATMNAKDIVYKDGKNVEQALNDLYSRDAYLYMDKTYLESGSLLGNSQITENNVNSSCGLSITGTGMDKRWEKEIDLTNYTILSFYGKKGSDHGRIQIKVDDTAIYFRSYSDMDGNWKRYLIDLSEYTGTHKLALYGGWSDSTGSATSNTQYCDIKLYQCKIN